MTARYLSQTVIFSVMGILSVKGMTLWLLDGFAKTGILLALLSAVGAAVLLAVLVRRETAWNKRLQKTCVLVLAFAAAAVRMWHVSVETEYQLQGLADGQAAAVQGRIIQKKKKEIENRNNSWTVCLTDSYLKTAQGIRSCGNILLYLNLEAGEPVIGNTITVTGNIIFFREARNDGNFDERAYYHNQGYSVKFYADDVSYQVKDTYTVRMREWLYHMQQEISAVYQKTMPQQEAGVLAAMLSGEKSQLLNETKELYRQSGIAHILAISGLHISVLGAAVFQLLRKKGVSYAVSSAISMSFLLAFGCMTGMSTSTARAVIMFGVYLGAACCGRAYDSMNGLAAAGAWILLKNPRALFLAGFQFSFAAVCGVLLGKEICAVMKPKYRLAETMLVSLSIQAVTLPLTAWYYFEIPVYSIFLNLIVLPFMTLVLITGLAGGMTGLLPGGLVPAKVMLFPCTAVLRYFSKAGELFLKLPGAVCTTGRPEGWQMVLYYLILAGCVQMSRRRETPGARCGQMSKGAEKQDAWCEPKSTGAGARCGQISKRAEKPDTKCSKENKCQKKKARELFRKKVFISAGFCCCMCILFVPLPKPAEVTVLDVGQGDGIYIRTSGGLDIFIDGGSSDVKQAGTYRILPFLKSQGVADIDYWFVSHLDQDHVSGLKEAAESGYGIGQAVFAKGVWKDEAYEKMLKQLADCRIQAVSLGKGDALRAGDAAFTALAPDEADTGSGRNENSLVLLYEDSGFSAFFSGDISQKEEQRLLADQRPAKTVLYKAAHHGSKHSNSEELLACLRPDVSLISCSADNDYGHPGKEAVEHMEQCGSTVYYTMHSGQIRVRWGKDGLQLMEFSAAGPE